MRPRGRANRRFGRLLFGDQPVDVLPGRCQVRLLLAGGQRRDVPGLDLRSRDGRGIGDGWVKDLSRLKALEPLAENPEFRARWREIKHSSKQNLAARALLRAGIVIDPTTGVLSAGADPRVEAYAWAW